jgi:ferredoxin
MTDPTIEIDLDLCNGYGNCVVAAPDVFDLDPETNLAVLRTPSVSADRLSAVREAAADCPVQAIRIITA